MWGNRFSCYVSKYIYLEIIDINVYFNVGNLERSSFLPNKRIVRKYLHVTSILMNQKYIDRGTMLNGETIRNSALQKARYAAISCNRNPFTRQTQLANYDGLLRSALAHPRHRGPVWNASCNKHKRSWSPLCIPRCARRIEITDPRSSSFLPFFAPSLEKEVASGHRDA